MLKAEQLQEMAHKAANRSETCACGDRFVEAEMALITCAIYTVGAELIGRLDNLHFEADSWTYRDGHMERIATTEGSLFTQRRNNDNSSKSKDSGADQEGTPTPESPEGKPSASPEDPEGSDLR